jgi:hypothetical protein
MYTNIEIIQNTGKACTCFGFEITIDSPNYLSENKIQHLQINKYLQYNFISLPSYREKITIHVVIIFKTKSDCNTFERPLKNK